MNDECGYVAYGPDLALAANGGVLGASPETALPTARPNAAAHPTSYRYHGRDAWGNPYLQPIGCYLWHDAPNSTPPWLRVEWRQPQRVDVVVLTLPILVLFPERQRTLGRLTVEYLESGTWRPVAPVSGQPNPVVGWTAPDRADGSQTRALTIDPVVTTAIRVRFDAGTRDGLAFLDKIEVYTTRPATPPFSLRSPARPAAGTVLRPGDAYVTQVTVTDAAGLAVGDLPISVTGSGAARTDRNGRATITIDTPRHVGRKDYVVTGGGVSRTVEVETQSTDTALAAALQWLEGEATTLEHGSRMRAYDGTVMYTPDGVASYAGLWVRDFQHMIEGHPRGIPVDHIRRGFAYLIRRQRSDGAMPNKVRVDGVPVYCPGEGCDGTFGPNPPPDNPQFMVKIAYHYFRLTGDVSLFREHRDQLVRGLEFLPRSPDTSLVNISPATPSSPYGYTDAIAKTGDLLFDSLLLHEAATNLAELLLAVGDDAEAHRWTGEAARIARDLQTLHDPATGMFLAASVDCRQVDIWGSAFAAYLRVVTDEQRERIGSYLAANYDQLVVRGQVRHTAPGEYWQRTIVPNRDVYQDGAYWALPSGWVALAIDHVDRELSRRMLLDLVRDFQRNGINEAINPRIGYVAVPRYVASATTVLPALRTLARPGRAPHR